MSEYDGKVSLHIVPSWVKEILPVKKAVPSYLRNAHQTASTYFNAVDRIREHYYKYLQFKRDKKTEEQGTIVESNDGATGTETEMVAVAEADVGEFSVACPDTSDPYTRPYQVIWTNKREAMFKEMQRHVLVACHPDKWDHPRATDIYKAVHECCEKKHLITLIYYLVEFDIVLPDKFYEKWSEVLAQACFDLEDDCHSSIFRMRMSYLWEWGNALTDEERHRMEDALQKALAKQGKTLQAE